MNSTLAAAKNNVISTLAVLCCKTFRLELHLQVKKIYLNVKNTNTKFQK
jgi:hypothetical protein